MSKPVMRVYYDTEFLEDSGEIDVISMGFLRDDGQELYFVLNTFDTLRVARHDWLMANVMPSIMHVETTSHKTGLGTPVKDLIITDPNLVTRSHARQMLINFVSDITPEWWAWYGAYDHVALCSLFGRMIDLPESWPMYTQDIKQFCNQAGNPQMPPQPAGHHNALADAKFNKVRYDFLVEKLEPTYWIISPNSLRRAKEYIDSLGLRDNKTRIITNPEQLRGLTIRHGKDHVVYAAGEIPVEMHTQIRISTR